VKRVAWSDLSDRLKKMSRLERWSEKMVEGLRRRRLKYRRHVSRGAIPTDNFRWVEIKEVLRNEPRF
jgi:hypothetical protein